LTQEGTDRMKNYVVAGSQITWGRDYQGNVLAEIAEAGFEGAPAGNYGGATPESIIAEYNKYGLRAGPGYMGANYWDPAATQDIYERAKALADFEAALNCTECFVADNGFQTKTASGKSRWELAAHPTPADSLTADQYKYAGAVLTKVGEIFLARGVKACFHNHVGSFIETRKEIDDLFAQTDRSKVFQGPDIGHLAWAGVDVMQYVRDYAKEIKCLHVKDIYPNVVKEGLAKGWTYSQFSDAGVFAEVGEGMVPVPEMIAVLNSVGYQGWFFAEIDRTTKATALESAKICRAYLMSLGY
jgi:inosose dehydratase